MKSFVILLSDPQADLNTVGGKGMSLARLARSGLPVPNGFHVTTEAYRYFVEHNDLQTGIDTALVAVDVSQPQTLETASQIITELFLAASIPDEIVSAIERGYASLTGRNPAVAVRSSATAEDLPEASFAGQQETYLNIIQSQDVVNAVRKCWASLWTARAIGYRARQKISPEGVALAVVVQELVFAEASGILFTANPINGQRDQMMVSASWGLGEAIVGGLVTPDSLTLEKPSAKVIVRETAQKLIQTVRIDGGTQEIQVPENLQNVPVLSDEQAGELYQLGLRIEELYHTPMDIEWTLAKGKFAIVQARPITALPEAQLDWPLPDPDGTYMRTSIADLMPQPLSPLFLTLGIPTLMDQMTPLARRVVGGTPTLGDYYFTSINTYAYMNSKFPARGWFWILFHLLPSYPRLIRRLVPLWREQLHPEYQSFVASKQDLIPGETSLNELWQEIQMLFEAAAFYMDGLMFATMGASAGSEMLLTKAYDKLVKKDGDPDATTLLMGWDNIPVRSEKSLYDLSLWVQKDPVLSEYLLNTATQELLEKLEDTDSIVVSQFAEFVTLLQTHLDIYGHVVFQLDFAEDLPRDHPEMMIETIKMYLQGKGTNPHKRQHASEQKRIRTTEVALVRLKGLKLWLFRKVLNWAQSLSEVREDALADMGLAYPKMRDLLHELGLRFVVAGIINNAEDIYWLEKDEIAASVEKLDQQQDVENLSSQVEKRKAFNQKVGKVTPPPMIPLKDRVMGFKSNIFIAQTEETQAGNILIGVPTSAGVVNAPACVLHDPEDFDRMRPGDVLVAGTTTPAWTPLFAMASAVVTDIGGPLSHGSIVAREYGIPAVMGTGVATRRIQNGQVITVDGTKGEVLLASSEEKHTEVSPPTEWPLPQGGVTFARGSLAEHTPSPVSPMFATLGLRIANRETEILWRDYINTDPTGMFVSDGFYVSINNYVYGGIRLGLKNSLAITKMSLSQIGPMLRGAVERWLNARDKFERVVAEWEGKDIAKLSSSELLDGICTVFAAAVKYYTVIQTTLPAASMGEIFFTRFYNVFVKRKNDPDATTFLFGFKTMPVHAEQSLFDIAVWVKQNSVLMQYMLKTSTEKLILDYKSDQIPGGIPANLWAAYRSRFDQYFEKYGRTAYDFDFANPTPAEAPSPQFDAVKLILEDKAINPYDRNQEALEKREQATKSVLNRIGWPRKGWFEKLLKKAHETGAIREDSIFDMGMGHPIIRSMFAELGRRCVAGNAIKAADDIYWLEEHELQTMLTAIESEDPLPNYADQIPRRKAEWQAALQIVPPVMLPEKSFWQRFIGGGAPEEKDGKTVLTGLGTSSGWVSAPACVLHGPEDFPRMKLGDVLVATTTTPAWTPLFALASAVVTDIGGPLSHSSIVAREYGIPAVMAARNATRYIQNGQIVTVDGKAGTVIFTKNGS